MTEEDLVGIWIVDPIQGTRLGSITHHFLVHGREVGAESIDQYLNRAAAFLITAKNRNGRGQKVMGKTLGVRRWEKLGKYIDVTFDGEIVSFGSVQR